MAYQLQKDIKLTTMRERDNAIDFTISGTIYAYGSSASQLDYYGTVAEPETAHLVFLVPKVATDSYAVTGEGVSIFAFNSTEGILILEIQNPTAVFCITRTDSSAKSYQWTVTPNEITVETVFIEDSELYG